MLYYILDITTGEYIRNGWWSFLSNKYIMVRSYRTFTYKSVAYEWLKEHVKVTERDIYEFDIILRDE